MVGGNVKEVLVGTDKVWINCQDKYGDTCAIYVRRDVKSELVTPGDSVWWHGIWAMWTPKSRKGTPTCNHRGHDNCKSKCGIDYDIKLIRVGFSGVSRP